MSNPSDSVPLRSGLPRHEQVSSWIREQIESNVLGVDDQLPSESQLCDRFSISRITVRRALQTLEAEDLIYKRQGLGSFVKGAKVRQGFVNLSDFVEDMSSAGINARSEVLHLEREVATLKIAQALEIAEGHPVIRLDRLRFGNDDPVAFDTTWMPLMIGQFISAGDLENETIYSVLENQAGIQICRARFRIESVNAPNDVAGHLDIPWGRALLLIERTTYSESGRPCCFQTRYYRCDRVAYELVLDRAGETIGKSGEGLPVSEFEPVFK